MWLNIYHFAHNTLGMHFWDLPMLLAGAVILAELFVHGRNEKKREEKLDAARAKRLETMQKENAGTL